MTLYLDASALVTRVTEERASGAVDAVLARHPTGVGVSEFAAAEVASALSRLVRMRLISREDGEARLVDFDAWRSMRADLVEIESSDFHLANIFVRRFDLMLRAPDALHAAVCRRLGLTMVTLDQRLARAAAALDVPVLNPTEPAFYG